LIGLIVVTKLGRTSSTWWRSNTTNNYGDMTRSSLHTPVEEELPPSFAVDPGAGLDDLVGDADDIEMHVVVKQK
jgi:hypothetical protein